RRGCRRSTAPRGPAGRCAPTPRARRRPPGRSPCRGTGGTGGWRRGGPHACPQVRAEPGQQVATSRADTGSMTTATTTPVIQADGLTKRFGSSDTGVQALAGLDLVAASGQVTAVLGPNGAGKSTLVRAVATLLDPDGGHLAVAGIDARRHPDQV